jgi:hypothetical protein
MSVFTQYVPHNVKSAGHRHTPDMHVVVEGHELPHAPQLYAFA